MASINLSLRGVRFRRISLETLAPQFRALANLCPQIANRFLSFVACIFDGAPEGKREGELFYLSLPPRQWSLN